MFMPYMPVQGLQGNFDRELVWISVDRRFIRGLAASGIKEESNSFDPYRQRWQIKSPPIVK